jgi:MoxR-like ATPase
MENNRAVLGQHGPAVAAPPGADAPHASALLDRLRANVAGVLLGKDDVIRLAIVTLLAEGHMLIEDVPGIGKTLLAKALARSLDCSFHRIQFTPDLLPSDLIGTSVFHQASGEFVFKHGPLFAQVILADEINRATPRTQSALLEAMSDRQATVDGVSRPLGPPFIVMATQNPYEFEGTYPLPESQLDRFLLRLRIGYPDREAEREILIRHRDGEPVDHLQSVLHRDDVLRLQLAVRQVRVENSLSDYILDLLAATRSHPDVYLGGSPRAALSLYRAAQASALIDARDYVVPDDIKHLAGPVLAHRLSSKNVRQGRRGDSAEEIVSDIVGRAVVPV